VFVDVHNKNSGDQTSDVCDESSHEIFIGSWLDLKIRGDYKLSKDNEIYNSAAVFLAWKVHHTFFAILFFI
jgi:hypothetical protein